MYDAQVPCLCCNTPVLIRQQDWGPTKVGLCMLCYQSIPFRIVLVVYSLRLQMGALYQQMQSLVQTSGA